MSFDYQEWLRAEDKMREVRMQALRGELYEHSKYKEIEKEYKRKAEKLT